MTDMSADIVIGRSQEFVLELKDLIDSLIQRSCCYWRMVGDEVSPRVKDGVERTFSCCSSLQLVSSIPRLLDDSRRRKEEKDICTCLLTSAVPIVE